MKKCPSFFPVLREILRFHFIVVSLTRLVFRMLNVEEDVVTVNFGVIS